MLNHFAIEILDHGDESVALELHAIFQQSYGYEARLIGVTDFPPLRRSVQDIRSAATTFYACRSAGGLGGVIEVSHGPATLHVESLVVHPDLLRHGIAASLLSRALAEPGWETIEVQTAQMNAPALSLYEKFGFERKQAWHSSEGIALVLLSRRR